MVYVSVSYDCPSAGESTLNNMSKLLQQSNRTLWYIHIKTEQVQNESEHIGCG